MKRKAVSLASPSKVKVHQGFTLIEVLLAMAITVIVSVIAYQAMDSVLNIVDSQEKQEDKIKKMGLFFTVFDKDFRQIVPRKIRDPKSTGFKHAFFYNKNANPMLEFTRGGWGNPAPQNFQRSHLQRVAYHLDDEKLIRKTWRAVDRYEDTQVDEVVLLEGVTEFSLRLLEDKRQSASTKGSGQQQPAPQRQTPQRKTKPWEWVTQWPSDQKPQQPQYNAQGQLIPQPASTKLPLSVEIEFQVKGWGKLKRVFELTAGDS